MNEQEFPQGSVPVAVAARVYGKDASWVRAGIISGWLPIGKATRSGKLVTTIEEMDSRYGRINFYISPKRLYEETGWMHGRLRLSGSGKKSSRRQAQNSGRSESLRTTFASGSMIAPMDRSTNLSDSQTSSP